MEPEVILDFGFWILDYGFEGPARMSQRIWPEEGTMIRKLASGEYRLYSRKKGKGGKRKNLGTFKSRQAAERHERQVQFFKKR